MGLVRYNIADIMKSEKIDMWLNLNKHYWLLMSDQYVISITDHYQYMWSVYL